MRSYRRGFPLRLTSANNQRVVFIELFNNGFLSDQRGLGVCSISSFQRSPITKPLIQIFSNTIRQADVQRNDLFTHWSLLLDDNSFEQPAQDIRSSDNSLLIAPEQYYVFINDIARSLWFHP